MIHISTSDLYDGKAKYLINDTDKSVVIKIGESKYFNRTSIKQFIIKILVYGT